MLPHNSDFRREVRRRATSSRLNLASVSDRKHDSLLTLMSINKVTNIYGSTFIHVQTNRIVDPI